MWYIRIVCRMLQLCSGPSWDFVVRFFVAFFCVTAQLHITALCSLGWWQPFHSLTEVISPSFKILLLMGELYFLLSYINAGSIVVLWVPLFSSVHFLCRLFHMKCKDKSRNWMNFLQFHQISAAHSYLAYL